MKGEGTRFASSPSCGEPPSRNLHEGRVALSGLLQPCFSTFLDIPTCWFWSVGEDIFTALERHNFSWIWTDVENLF